MAQPVSQSSVPILAPSWTHRGQRILRSTNSFPESTTAPILHQQPTTTYQSQYQTTQCRQLTICRTQYQAIPCRQPTIYRTQKQTIPTICRTTQQEHPSVCQMPHQATQCRHLVQIRKIIGKTMLERHRLTLGRSRYSINTLPPLQCSAGPTQEPSHKPNHHTTGILPGTEHPPTAG